MQQQVCILGSTGSIGQSTLAVIRNHAERYQVHTLTANNNINILREQCIEFHPKRVFVVEEQAGKLLQEQLQAINLNIEVAIGETELAMACDDVDIDIVMAAIVGSAGLIPTYNAVCKGLKVLLANKEALVMSGQLFMKAVQKYQATLLPIDSEHNAIYQCLPQASQQLGGDLELAQQGINRIILTGSGGPFLNLPIDKFADIQPEQALQHPNWTMGAKITIDSATMMNKGLEFIEACYLFNLTSDQIDVVIHPQSVIHSMVSYIDGSTLAQLGQPDMQTPIAYGLAYPERIHTQVPPLDFLALTALNFTEPSVSRYPNLYLAKQAFNEGQSRCIQLNAVNEVTVAAFLKKEISFIDIGIINNKFLQQMSAVNISNLDDVLAMHQESMLYAQTLLDNQLASQNANKGLSC